MLRRFVGLALLVGCVAATFAGRAGGADLAPEIAEGDFGRLLAAIKPQPGESPWREIPWLTDVTEARRQAIAQDKPILILTAADGSPLSRT